MTISTDKMLRIIQLDDGMLVTAAVTPFLLNVEGVSTKLFSQFKLGKPFAPCSSLYSQLRKQVNNVRMVVSPCVAGRAMSMASS